jgi:hypothetical protein
MAHPFSAQHDVVSVARPSGTGRLLVWAGAGGGAVLLLGAVLLWFHYGTAVFFETIAAGFAACI